MRLVVIDMKYNICYHCNACVHNHEHLEPVALKTLVVFSAGKILVQICSVRSVLHGSVWAF